MNRNASLLTLDRFRLALNRIETSKRRAEGGEAPTGEWARVAPVAR